MTHSRLAASRSARRSLVATLLKTDAAPCDWIRSPTLRPSIRSPTAMKRTTGGTVALAAAVELAAAVGTVVAVAGTGEGVAVASGVPVAVGAGLAVAGRGN